MNRKMNFIAAITAVFMAVILLAMPALAHANVSYCATDLQANCTCSPAGYTPEFLETESTDVAPGTVDPGDSLQSTEDLTDPNP